MKKDKTIKIAIDARCMVDAILNDNYQMPNFDKLIDQEVEFVNIENEGEVTITSMDKLYAYGPSCNRKPHDIVFSRLSEAGQQTRTRSIRDIMDSQICHQSFKKSLINYLITFEIHLHLYSAFLS